MFDRKVYLVIIPRVCVCTYVHCMYVCVCVYLCVFAVYLYFCLCIFLNVFVFVSLYICWLGACVYFVCGVCMCVSEGCLPACKIFSIRY